MGNIGVQEAMQGDMAKMLDTAIEVPFKVMQILIEIKKNSAEAGRDRVITQIQKHKLRQVKQLDKSGNVRMKDLGRNGQEIAELTDIDKSCLSILKKNLNEAGIKYHVDAYRNENGNREFAISFEDKDAQKVEYAIDRSVRQMMTPGFMRKSRDKPSVLEALSKAKERAALLNQDLVEKHKLKEQSR